MNGRGNNLVAAQFERLTRRETEVLALLADGHSAPEIAEKLTLALSSVKWYVQQVYGKLGVNSKRQAIKRAQALGWLSTAADAAREQVSATPPHPPSPQHNLPLQITRFFGRELDVPS
jgi:DNA-binding CsgD family transcriptional regulator